MRNVEQNARIYGLFVGTWLDILDITHVILCGDDRFILCADDHLSASFAYMYAIGQIAKQFIFVNITSQESLPVRRNRGSFKHALSLRSATVRSMIDCFRLFVPDNIYSANSFKLRGDIYGRIISGEYSSNVDKLGHLSQDEYLLVVGTLLDIPLGPISIPVALGPYQKWTEGTPDFHVQRNSRGCIA